MTMAAVAGISAYYHDSAAAIVRDGKLLAAAQEERFSRTRHDAAFPARALAFCLRHAGVALRDLDAIVFYDKPLAKFDRLLETYLTFAPRGWRSFVTAMPVWLKEKLFLKRTLRAELCRLGECDVSDLPPLLFSEHHQAHAASAYFPSPFDEAAVLCLDGVGEWATTSGWLGRGSTLVPLWEIRFPHSLGLLYSAFTYFAGFKVNSGEYKLMGLASYGRPRYAQTIRDELVDIKPDGSFRLNLDYFDFCTGLTMTNRRFDRLFGGPPREPEATLTAREMDLAASVQCVTEDIVVRLAHTMRTETGFDTLCLAGGVALNCVANARLLRDGVVRRLWVQPAAGDAGGAVGAAWLGWTSLARSERAPDIPDGMQGALLGTHYSNETIQATLDAFGARYRRATEHEVATLTAERIAGGAVVGWFQGRMEFGPRALGSRSILADPRNDAMQSLLNRKIKFRESFRPFAPAVLEENAGEYFDLDAPSPYMTLVAPVREALREAPSTSSSGIDSIRERRSTIPAVTHVDYSARLQTVGDNANPRFRRLLEAFKATTGCAVLVNTSFNVRGEPIVEHPSDAYRCFMRTGIDCLVIGDFVLDKARQPQWSETQWRSEFALD
jgi:carbamoyltransferase